MKYFRQKYFLVNNSIVYKIRISSIVQGNEGKLQISSKVFQFPLIFESKKPGFSQTQKIRILSRIHTKIAFF